ncbi:hypothetical protein ACX0G9_16360 [Flavitalea flava]
MKKNKTSHPEEKNPDRNPGKPEEDKKVRFLSIRLSPTEMEQVNNLLNNTTCRSLTEYVKKVLTRKPVLVNVRNQSVDELLEVMIDIKNKLELLAGKLTGENGQLILQETKAIKLFIRQIWEKWSTE